ncbi:MAG: sugar-binding domain-containing protein [Draconibacterium sp.]
MKQAPLMTTFANDVDPDNVLPEYPRPQMQRNEWLNLNGIWQFQPGTGSQEAMPSGQLSGSILVPFPVESAISGVMEHHSRLWYRKNFEVPENWNGKRIMLNFGAVDYETEVFVNGESVGVHYGGYDPFGFDITGFLTEGESQELTVRVFDPTDEKGIPRGKQTLHPQGIMYTSTTGIWQTVWLEPVPETRIQTIKLVPDIDNSVLKVKVTTSGNSDGFSVQAVVSDSENVVKTVSGAVNQEFTISISSPKLWSPDDPFLYNLDLTLYHGDEKADSVHSYFGMRKIAVEVEDGIKKLYLNNEFLFQMGPLDQGFWPDGIYTAPTDEALKYDLEMIKKFGFNMVRKHIKVEPQRWYYWADKLGVMVWQDMPSVNSYTNMPQPIDQTAFKNELNQMIENHWNSPSIVMWVVFNEFQGEHNTVDLVNMVETLDPSRLVNQGSGGPWHGAGDVYDLHNYPPPVCPKSTSQAVVCGEYGGIGLEVDGHTWSDGYFGYVTVADAEELMNDYEGYIDQLTMFKTNEGLSAAVYTEITDVEIELNGLMTYDRVVKADVNRIFAANRKVIEDDIYLSTLLASAKVAEPNWKYRFDSPAYNWYEEDFDDSSWRTGTAGFGTDGTPGAIVRTVWNTPDIWIRKNFELGDLSSVNRDELVLYIHHDEDCEVYINGVWAVSLTGWTTGYITIPISNSALSALRSGALNTIAIHCKQTAGGQYIDAGISLMSDKKLTTGFNEINKKSNPLNCIYPNPAGNTLHFLVPFKQPALVAVYSSEGTVVKLEKEVRSQLDISALVAGTYYLRVFGDEKVTCFKFVKT